MAFDKSIKKMKHKLRACQSSTFSWKHVYKKTYLGQGT